MIARFTPFFLLLFFSTTLWSKIYYVSPRGDDDNPGTYKEPKSSIQEGVALLQPGDTLYLRAGIYSLIEPVKINILGNPQKWTLICSYPKEKTLIDASAVESILYNAKKNKFNNNGAITIASSSYLNLQDLHVVNAHNMSYYIQENAHHIQMNRCSSEKSYNAGIGAWYADSVQISHCTITQANDQSLRPQGAPIEDQAPYSAITIAGCTHFDVNNNKISKCFNSGIECRELSSHGLIHHNEVSDTHLQALFINGWYGVMEDVEIHSNMLYNSEWGIVISAEGEGAFMKDIRIHHNFVFNNRGSGIHFSVWGRNNNRTGIFVYNNTVYQNGTPGHWAGSTGGIDLRSDKITDVYIINNISYNNYAFDIATFNNILKGISALEKFNIVIDHNLTGEMKSVDEKKGDLPRVYQYLGENYIIGDPKLTDPQQHNFKIAKDSPAIDAATTDFPFDTGKDMGACSEGYKPNVN